MTEKEIEKSGKKYWYLIYITECVLCGAGERGRERQYSPKPENEADRYRYRQFACDHHFL